MKWLRILLVNLLEKELVSDDLYSTSRFLIRYVELIEVRGGNLVEELAKSRLDAVYARGRNWTGSMISSVKSSCCRAMSDLLILHSP